MPFFMVRFQAPISSAWDGRWDGDSSATIHAGFQVWIRSCFIAGRHGITPLPGGPQTAPPERRRSTCWARSATPAISHTTEHGTQRQWTNGSGFSA